MHGAHCIRHWATKQTTLSLSSGESELHGIPKGIRNGIGFQSWPGTLTYIGNPEPTAMQQHQLELLVAGLPC